MFDASVGLEIRQESLITFYSEPSPLPIIKKKKKSIPSPRRMRRRRLIDGAALLIECVSRAWKEGTLLVRRCISSARLFLR